VLFMQCLQATSYEDLVNADVTAPKYFSPFAPTIDGRTVMPEPIARLTDYACGISSSPLVAEGASGSSSSSTPSSKLLAHSGIVVPVMAGVVTYEGFAHLGQMDLGGTSERDASRENKGVSTEPVQYTSTRFAAILRTYVQNVFQYHQQKIFDILTHNYNDWERGGDARSSSRHDGGGIQANVVELIGDGQIVAPMVRLVQKLANCSGNTKDSAKTAKPAVYYYSFGRRTVSTDGMGFTDWTKERGVYGEDIQYILGSPLVDGIDPFPSEYTDADRRLSETMLLYWTNFIKTGYVNKLNCFQ